MPHGDWDGLSAAQAQALRDLFHKPGATTRARYLRGVRMSTLNSLVRLSQIRITHPVGQERVDCLTYVAITDSGMCSIGVGPYDH